MAKPHAARAAVYRTCIARLDAVIEDLDAQDEYLIVARLQHALDGLRVNALAISDDDETFDAGAVM